jgi:hypothetical protein
MHRWTRYKDPKGELRTYDGTWTVKCRDCGRQRVVSSVPLIVVTVVAIVAGLVIVFTVGSLLGAALIIAGIGGLGVAMMPGLLERFASWLGGGTRRRW